MIGKPALAVLVTLTSLGVGGGDVDAPARPLAKEPRELDADGPSGPRALVASLAHTIRVAGAPAYQQLGRVVAISADGSRVLVGASEAEPRVYSSASGTWIEEATLAASGGAVESTDVALSADGDRAIVAYASSSSEDVHVFVRLGTTWSEEAVLSNPSPGVDDGFGSSVALSADGSVALIGEVQDDNAGGVDAGTVHVYVRAGTTWTRDGAVVTGTAARSYVGGSVALSGDGTHALVTADSGVRSFDRMGVTWSEGSGLAPDGGGTFLAPALTLSADGARALVGTDGVGTTITGSGYVFARTGTNWAAEGLLSPERRLSDSQFGSDAAISADGTRAIVSDLYYGTARLYSLEAGAWVGGETIEGAPDISHGGLFGHSVAIDAAGAFAIVGASQWEMPSEARPQTGAAFIFSVEEPPPPPDAGPSPDAGSPVEPAAPAGCACRAGHRSGPPSGAPLGLVLVVLVAWRARARRAVARSARA